MTSDSRSQSQQDVSVKSKKPKKKDASSEDQAAGGGEATSQTQLAHSKSKKTQLGTSGKDGRKTQDEIRLTEEAAFLNALSSVMQERSRDYHGFMQMTLDPDADDLTIQNYTQNCIGLAQLQFQQVSVTAICLDNVLRAFTKIKHFNT